MKQSLHPITRFIITGLLLLLLLLTNIMPESAMAHGGKKHGDARITRYEVLQKAINFYDSLLKNNKLEETWETHLMGIRISTRKEKEVPVFIVAFERSEQTPQTLYLFFDNSGEYIGANYTGQ